MLRPAIPPPRIMMCSAEDVVMLLEANFCSAVTADAAAEDRGIIAADNCLLFDWAIATPFRLIDHVGKLPLHK